MVGEVEGGRVVGGGWGKGIVLGLVLGALREGLMGRWLMERWLMEGFIWTSGIFGVLSGTMPFNVAGTYVVSVYHSIRIIDILVHVNE